jgi:hypothetical protein
MHIEFLVEEPSMEVALSNLVPKITGADTSFQIRTFQGKSDLLNKLPQRLRGYKQWIPGEYRIVVVIDQDQENCHKLKNNLEQEAQRAGFITKSQSRSGGFFQVVNRIAIEELEAWFFGDWNAVKEAYPRVPDNIERKAPYRNPDSIKGGTWEALERVLKKSGYFKGGLNKIAAAGDISEHMDPSRNQSKSFQVFRDGLLSLVQTST